ncbi:MAG: hypothetical protein COT74_13085 [Bdellovibrionales bacterium CG10_big_fil_rev_8_21_14_0_10_45_34]|nr:MAG: hypothetical protein COT74_13085 [Bdellovibrionales bacterium CG10_big_fil_rev_8_21_14_0_10_45_34]
MVWNKKITFAYGALLGGLLTQTYLTYHFFAIRFGRLAEKSVCNINATFNCDAVAASEYSELFGAPISLWSVWIHVALLVLMMAAQFDENEVTARRKARLSVYGAGFIAILSVIMGSISFFKLGALCIFCLMAYGFSFLLFGFVFAAIDFKRTGSEILTDLKSLLLFRKSAAGLEASLLVAIPIVTFITADMVQKSVAKGLPVITSQSLQEWRSNEEMQFSQRGLVKGDTKDPKMTIVEFADFQCIHCKMAGPTLDAFVNSRPHVLLIFKGFPLDPQCNPNMEGGQSGGTSRSCTLARMVWCADKQGRGWQAHDWVFDNFGAPESSDAVIMAKELALNEKQLLECLQSDDSLEGIIEIAREGKMVRGTPTILVNGKVLPSGQSMTTLNALYKEIVK